MSSSALRKPHKIIAGGLLRMHAADRVSSMLVALVLVIGTAVVVMTAIYFSRLKADAPKLIQVEIEEEKIAGRGDHAAGIARDFAPPGQEEVQELTEPTLQQTLEAVTSAITTVAAALETVESASIESTQGSGLGDSRPPGPLGDGDDIIPRFERWDLKFAARDVKAYAAQLDYFKIELAAIGGGINTVDYAANFAGTPSKHSGKSEDEKRLYFMWRTQNVLQQYDMQLLQKSGVKTTGRKVIKFLTKELETHLATLEKTYAVTALKRDVRAREFAKTVFECRPTSSGKYEWVVLEQKYRNPPPMRK